MRRSSTGSPTPIRPLSIDSLCIADNEISSVAMRQELSPPLSPPAIVDSLHDDSARDSVATPLASDYNTMLGPKRTESPAQQSSPADPNALCLRYSHNDSVNPIRWHLALKMDILPAAKYDFLNSYHSSQKLYDGSCGRASRGPMGSLSLFYLWKPQSRILPPMVYAASLITIAALAMGPFTQQVIMIQADNLVIQEGINSTIAVSNYYNHDPTNNEVGMSLTETGGFEMGGNSFGTDVEPDVQGSFYNGCYNLGKSSLDFSCPSSNCSWDAFNSLGLCSTCQDVSETTQIVGSLSSAVSVLTPQGWFVNSINAWDRVVAIANETFVHWMLEAFPGAQKFDTLSASSTLENLPASLVSMIFLQISNITVINGKLQEHYSIQELPLWPVAGQDFGGLARGQRAYNWELLLTPNTDRSNTSSPWSPFDHGGLNVSIYEHTALSSFLVDKFNTSGPESESKATLFGNGQNVTSTIRNITDSMTNAIVRSSSKLPALGIVWHQEPVIHVQWAWLALPLVLVLLSAILLASTVVATKRFHAPQWKSSPLPLLYHGIRNWDDDEEQDLVEGRLERVHVMEDRARSKQVRIFTTSKGGRWLTV
ncbi:hypothetical protein J7T55_010861 [Diaporthe amygdali]|uniref:uncharacterized protein n=1 Tax=Phomopsis amygdali TaxID=1214568 RepID=UPI0022FDCC0B|nr:uncharacterized protein J7T55_010861 [Diaporthe amygdali]KAJ0114471.1 hypothetical protein J7T55_010861 [Diaporthe amygdali]